MMKVIKHKCVSILMQVASNFTSFVKKSKEGIHTYFVQVFSFKPSVICLKQRSVKLSEQIAVFVDFIGAVNRMSVSLVLFLVPMLNSLCILLTI